MGPADNVHTIFVGGARSIRKCDDGHRHTPLHQVPGERLNVKLYSAHVRRVVVDDEDDTHELGYILCCGSLDGVGSG